VWQACAVEVAGEAIREGILKARFFVSGNADSQQVAGEAIREGILKALILFDQLL
jgi:hypothetical protein